ncbi:MAG TPA: glycosyltransferase, partial [Patescibacteria group bacterium]|nr:glycosyltransferase [Patescibacteria group bacterium]
IKEVINYPDSLYGWYPYAIKTVEDVLQKERFDAVISSSPPVTSHLIAQYLCEKHEIPWVADFRDLWTQDHYRSYSMFRNIIERRLEKSTMKKAGALVTVSEPLVEKLKSLHGNEDVFSVPNGFDPMLWRDNIDNLTEKFSITYTGTIYEGKRDPTPLFEALVQLINSQRVARERIEVRFYGPQDMGNWLRVRVAKLKLEDIVKYYGVVSRQEALLRQRESQMLLLLNWNDPEEKGVYTGKVFEYLCAQRPILALGSVGGVVQELLAETKAGISVSSQSELEEVVLAGYQEYFASGRTTYSGCKKEIMKYSHREMALKFSRILDMVSSAPAKLLNIT